MRPSGMVWPGFGRVVAVNDENKLTIELSFCVSSEEIFVFM